MPSDVSGAAKATGYLFPMDLDARSRLGGLVDRALDWTVVPGYSKIGFELRERLVPRGPLDLDGKTAIVTGATSGIGEAACSGLARGGAEVHMVVRDPAKGEEARSRISRAAGVDEKTVALHRCDLSNLASVRSFAAAFSRGDRQLDVLVNNAGVLPPRRIHTDEGFELTFATNVLGPFLLTARLVPRFAAAARRASSTSPPAACTRPGSTSPTRSWSGRSSAATVSTPTRSGPRWSSVTNGRACSPPTSRSSRCTRAGSRRLGWPTRCPGSTR